MIITLGLVGFIIIGIIFLQLGNIKKISWEVGQVLDNIGIFLICLGIVGSMFTGAFIVSNYIGYDIKYQNKLHEKEMLEYRIEHMTDNFTCNEMLYSDIVEFNNELRSTKKWANSPWTNWFNNQDIAAIDYIELGN